MKSIILFSRILVMISWVAPITAGKHIDRCCICDSTWSIDPRSSVSNTTQVPVSNLTDSQNGDSSRENGTAHDLNSTYVDDIDLKDGNWVQNSTDRSLWHGYCFWVDGWNYGGSSEEYWTPVCAQSYDGNLTNFPSLCELERFDCLNPDNEYSFLSYNSCENSTFWVTTTMGPGNATTMKPINTTSVPGNTTSGPSNTTVGPSNTTSGPSNTTLVPSNTTSGPSNTTVRPSNTTYVPSNTTSVPSNTTSGPSNTTVIPSNTTSGPSNTTSGSSNTTVRPSNTTSGPSNTTSGPSNTTSGPSNTTSGPSNTTSGPSNTTSGPSNTTSEPSNTTSGPSNTTSGPSNTTSGPSNTTSGPSNTTVGPSNTTVGPSNTTSGPSNTTSGPSNTTSGPSNTTSGPSNTTSGPNNTTSGPSNTTVGPSNTTVVPSNTTSGPSNNTSGPSNTTVGPSNTTVRPSNTTSGPSNTTSGPSNTTSGPSNTTSGPSNTTSGPSNTTSGPSNTTVVPSNTTSGPTNTTVVPSNTTVNSNSTSVKPPTPVVPITPPTGTTAVPTNTTPPIPANDVSLHPNVGLVNSDSCGTAQQATTKILNGYNADLFQYPWMALLVVYWGDGNFSQCGGSVINNRYLLTAAHCVLSPTNASIVNAVVLLGINNYATDWSCFPGSPRCLDPPQVVYASDVIPNKAYSPSAGDVANDVALLRFNRTVAFNKASVRPICLPVGLQEQARAFNGENVTVAGWGVTATGAASSQLQAVQVPTQSSSSCNAIINNVLFGLDGNNVSISQGQMCAGSGVKDSCSGDSGGPLFHPGLNQSSAYTQYGIVSFGPECGSGLPIPGVYTRVGYYMKWILDNMKA